MYIRTLEHIVTLSPVEVAAAIRSIAKDFANEVHRCQLSRLHGESDVTVHSTSNGSNNLTSLHVYQPLPSLDASNVESDHSNESD